MNQRFGKSYKLCSKKKIDETYQNGAQIKSFPFYAKYQLDASTKSLFQIVFVVPKKKFRLATTRNKIRRYIREAIRHEKQVLENALEVKQLKISVFLLYSGETELNLPDTQNAMRKLIKKITHEIENH